MEEQFVPYELALKLKELGFDEYCIAFYAAGYDPLGNDIVSLAPLTSDATIGFKGNKDTLLAPLWQQVIDWLREKHNIEVEAYRTMGIANEKTYGCLGQRWKGGWICRLFIQYL